MGNRIKWRRLMQPDWYVNAVRDMITSLSGGYEEAVSWIGKKKAVMMTTQQLPRF